MREGTDLYTGCVLYQITAGSLEGSFDSRISIRVSNQELSQTGFVTTDWYIYIEGSCHKAMLGHNIYGGPTDFYFSASWLVNKVGEILGIVLPCVDDWEVKRVDYAECFDLGGFAACEEWFFNINNACFPRRQVNKFGTTGLYVPGSTTTVKFYHKGPEFRKHDRARLIRCLNERLVFELNEIADCIIRAEIEIKAKKLKYDNGKLPLVKDLKNDYIERIYNKEIEKIIKDGEDDMETVRRTKAVHMRLFSKYTPELASRLYGMWQSLCTLGEKGVRDDMGMSRATFYRNRKLLKDAGVSWLGTDIIKSIELVPEDFSPVSTDIRKVDISLEEAKQHLKIKQVVNM